MTFSEESLSLLSAFFFLSNIEENPWLLFIKEKSSIVNSFLKK